MMNKNPTADKPAAVTENLTNQGVGLVRWPVFSAIRRRNGPAISSKTSCLSARNAAMVSSSSWL